MNFLSVLKKVGKGAEVVGKDVLQVAGPAMSTAAMIDPALAPVAALVSGVSRSVLAVSAKPLTATDKKSSVLETVEAMSPVLAELLLSKTGHQVTDEARFQKGVDALIEGTLDVYKSFGAIPTAPVAPAPPPLTTTTTTAKE